MSTELPVLKPADFGSDHLFPVDLNVADLAADLLVDLEQLLVQPEGRRVETGAKRQDVDWLLLALYEGVHKVLDHLSVGLDASPGSTVDDRVHLAALFLQEKLGIRIVEVPKPSSVYLCL